MRRISAMRQRDDVERRDLPLWILFVLTISAGLFGLVGFFREGQRSWPKPLAFAWFTVFATGLVIEIVRRRRAAGPAAEAGDLPGKQPRELKPSQRGSRLRGRRR